MSGQGLIDPSRRDVAESLVVLTLAVIACTPAAQPPAPPARAPEPAAATKPAEQVDLGAVKLLFADRGAVEKAREGIQRKFKGIFGV